MVQLAYMSEEPPFGYQDEVARRVQPVVQDMMESALAACGMLYGR
jgi:hypothetical protein